MNYKINATCENPNFYYRKLFSTLKNEDPSMRCRYDLLTIKCKSFGSEIVSRYIIAITILSFLTFSLLICSIICCCKLLSLNSRANIFKNQISKISKKNSKIDSDFINKDKQKLLA